MRDSIGRCRRFCSSTYKDLILLDVRDHVQHRLSLIKLEAALVKTEAFLHEIERQGGAGGGVLARMIEGLILVNGEMQDAIGKLPSKQNPAPFPVGDI